MTFREDHFTRAYGEQGSKALLALSGVLEELFERHCQQFAEQFRSSVSHDEVLTRLTEDEQRAFQERDASHTLSLPRPDLTQAEHEAAATQIGFEQALVGADMLSRIDAFNRLQEAAVRSVSAANGNASICEHAARAISSRIFLDMRYRIASYRRVNDGVSLAIARINEVAIKATNLPDLVHGVLAIIASLDGDVSGLFGRSDAHGRLEIEASIGHRAEVYHEAVEHSEGSRITLVAPRGAEPTPIQRAWSSGSIVALSSWAADSTLGAWRELGLAIGFRSAAAIPLLDRAGRSIALFNLYSSWPGFFSSRRVQYFLTHAQKILSHGLQLQAQTRITSLGEQRRHLDLLRRRRLQMLYQPVVELRTAQVAKFEALARLVADDGRLITPGEFLPALGTDELLSLFEQGLQQSLEDHAKFNEQAIRAQISINFPPEGLIDPRYEEVLFSTLAASGVDPNALVLEILESSDLGASGERIQGFLARLRDAGVLIAQDDLGSGHSSLLRLEQFSFDAVKIDQGLVRGAMAEPQHALEFILHLTRLAHARKVPVTIEGLENEGLIEAATLLGADFGQGYAIARPMPARDVASWVVSRPRAPSRATITTALGAMAGHLLWDMEFAIIESWSQLKEEFLALPCAVDEFIEHNKLRGGMLERTLRHTRAIAMGGRHTALYGHARSKLLSILREHWVDGLSRSNSSATQSPACRGSETAPMTPWRTSVKDASREDSEVGGSRTDSVPRRCFAYSRAATGGAQAG